MTAITIKEELNRGDTNNAPQLLGLIKLGDMLDVAEYDTGTITGVAAVPLPGGALMVQSARVVTSATGGSVGVYIASDSAATPLLPPGGASVAVGVAALAADGSTLTFPNTVTRVIVRYVKKPAVALSSTYR